MFSEHETKVFSHPRIVEFHKFFSEYHFWFEVGAERFKMSIRIYETNDGRFYFVQSHFLHTPLDERPVIPPESKLPTPQFALNTAVDAITTYYDRAVQEGHEPAPDWFHPNTLF